MFNELLNKLACPADSFAAVTRDLDRKSLPLLPIQNEAVVVDLHLVNQLRDELLPDAVVSSKTGNS